MSGLPKVDMVLTGERIAELRLKNNMTVKDLQELFRFNTPQLENKYRVEMHEIDRGHRTYEADAVLINRILFLSDKPRLISGLFIDPTAVESALASLVILIIPP